MQLPLALSSSVSGFFSCALRSISSARSAWCSEPVRRTLRAYDAVQRWPSLAARRPSRHPACRWHLRREDRAGVVRPACTARGNLTASAPVVCPMRPSRAASASLTCSGLLLGQQPERRPDERGGWRFAARRLGSERGEGNRGGLDLPRGDHHRLQPEPVGSRHPRPPSAEHGIHLTDVIGIALVTVGVVVLWRAPRPRSP